MAEDRDREPLTGAVGLFGVVRHLVQHGPARNDAERAELLAEVDRDDPKNAIAPQDAAGEERF
jgi:hypothetical protein